MKKLSLILIAAVMAIGMSSFTSGTYDDVNYKITPDGPLVPIDNIEPCPENGSEACMKYIPVLGDERQLFHDNGDPYLWDAPTLH